MSATHPRKEKCVPAANLSRIRDGRPRAVDDGQRNIVVSCYCPRAAVLLFTNRLPIINEEARYFGSETTIERNTTCGVDSTTQQNDCIHRLTEKDDIGEDRQGYLNAQAKSIDRTFPNRDSQLF
jgi:hypothetical protein